MFTIFFWQLKFFGPIVISRSFIGFSFQYPCCDKYVVALSFLLKRPRISRSKKCSFFYLLSFIFLYKFSLLITFFQVFEANSIFCSGSAILKSFPRRPISPAFQTNSKLCTILESVILIEFWKRTLLGKWKKSYQK